MRGHLVRWGLVIALLSVSFYALRGDETKIPDLVLDTYTLLKKPIESLLPDLDETSTQEIALDENTPLNLEAYQDLHNQRERWNEMRALIESGQPLYTPLPSEVVISTNPTGRLAPAVPPPPGFTVQLPYESRLTVSGRKTIGFTYQYSGYSNANYATIQGLPTTTSNVTLQQQLQVRINGQVGRKVTVNVDFDDTKTDKQDISIVYKGDPDEIVQRAAFGDITLSLPQTQFAGYNKQLFGASVEMKYKALHVYAVGSRTKGQTETKQFTGNVITQRLYIPDNSYIRHKYYNVTKMTGASADTPINLASLQVYLDNRDPSRVTFSLPPNTTIDGTLLPGATNYSGNFVLLSQGVDYSFDPNLGVLTLKNAVQSNAVIAINYIPNGSAAPISQTRGIPGLLKMLKFDETVFLAIPVTEDLTHYSFGASPIVRDNGQGNFTMQVLDINNNIIGPSLGINYLPNNAGNIFVDFEGGVFNLVNILLDTKNPTYADIYTFTPNHHFNFFTEFQARIKTYTLRPNIVLNSERIVLDGRVLTRDVDYFIDYTSGFITFFNPDQITQTSTVQATYDFSPFGIAGAQQDTLVGERTELSFYPISPVLSKSLIGSTVLYDFAPQPTAAPNITQTAGSFLLTESDIDFKDLVFDPLPLLKSSFALEGARSASNPNTFGEALIDNMEGIKDETIVNLSLNSWQIASNPTYTDAFATSLYTGMGNELIPTLSINPDAAALSGDQTQVLDLNYNLTQSSEASVVTVLSPTGVDFSRKLFLEMFIQGDGSNATGSPSGTQLNITMGQINEDADGTHGGGFTDSNGVHPLGDGTPRTEDLNHNNTLDVGEDIGWTYFNPDGSKTQIGAGNLRLDTEDLNRNGLLDTGNPFVGGNVGYNDLVSSFQATGASGLNTLDYSGWQFIRVPLNISSATASNWTQIEEVRISLKAGTFGGHTGLIKIGKIDVVGNKWQAQPTLVVGSTITAYAINTETDPQYVSPAGNPDFDALNQINGLISGPQPTRRKEQSLAINYSFAGGIQGASATVVGVYTTPMDFTAYKTIRMFVYGDHQGETFFFQAGSNTDFWEFSVPVTWTGWQELRILQQSTTGDQRPNIWQADPNNPPGATAFVQGNPNLASIAQLTAGIQDNNSAGVGGQIWLDEIHAANVITRIGYAMRMNADFEVIGWAKFGIGVKDIDRNFQTFDSAISNQDRHEEKAYLNFTRLAYFPMNFQATKTRTITPDINQITNTSLVSVQQTGRVDDQLYSATGTLQLPKYPKIGMLYDTEKTDTDDLFRTDKTVHYGGTLDYTVPGEHTFLPKSISLGYKRTNLGINFTPDALINASDPFLVSNTRDYTNDESLKLSFQPRTGFTFNPNVSRSETHEYRDAIVDSNTLTTMSIDYDTLRSQTMGFDSTLAFKRWFSPRLRYTETNQETYGIPLSTQENASDFKTVDRTSTGQADWDFAWRDFSHKFRALQSLTVSSSYLLEDGDTWNNVAAGYNTLDLFSVRQPLNPGNPEAALQDSTLRDTLRSTQRWNPFDWATNWTGAKMPLRTLSITSTVTHTEQRSDTTGSTSRVLTEVYPDLIFSLTQTERFFNLQRIMSNSQLNLKTQFKTVNTEDTSIEKVQTDGGDWRFTMWKKLDFFFSYTRSTDVTFDEINDDVSNDAFTDDFTAQLGFNVGRWRITPKYEQSRQSAVGPTGIATADLTTRTPALQLYADLFLPAGMKLPFSDLIIFSNRVRTTSTLSLTQKRSSLNEIQNDTDTYALTTSEDYEITSNVRLTVGGSYSYQVNKVSSEANFFSYTLNSLMTIQF